MQDDYGNALAPHTAKSITSRLDEGDMRMTRIEHELQANTVATQQVQANTEEMVKYFVAMKGAFRVLNWIGKVAKPITYIVMLGTAGIAFWKALMVGGGGR
ncbi:MULTISPECIES: hypothetical protein [Delftia]|jgi:hypothetical protein|uniref:t-SNARE coiled-coil homology domain-containing protein n=1 Tax=Delftia tsuruhatensis TaxID=180282 RepID=A0ABM6DY26_9BURK|nr:hypothetical protein [Delftia tsuruhatensis]AOU99913.1 hypothetical protein BI380_00360 [Delftia tsuruhatensis]MCO5338246.1 hypothetical protein [Delftia tsuruhatensis]MCR4545644.1 hypothetical protein [Delftia tsuruhatensis]MDH2232883.1 hypothetical protein [Delftia tsuruhatensis]